MTDYETLLKYRLEAFERYAMHQALVKQAERAKTGRRKHYTIITNLVRIVSIVLAQLR